MSDRLLSGRGQYLSKAAKVGYKQFYMCGFEGTDLLNTAQWLSWLERRPVTAEVESSSLFWVVVWGLSSAGRASALQAEGHRFEPYRPHITWMDSRVAKGGRL